MANFTNKTLRRGYEGLRKIMERMTGPRKEQPHPQLALQPVRNRSPRLRPGSATEQGAQPAGG